MSLLFMDSFDHYITADLQEKWNALYLPDGSTLSVSATNGRRSTASLRFSISGNNTRGTITKTVGASGAVAILGFAFRPTNVAGSGRAAIATIWNTTTLLATLSLNSDGTLSVIRGDHSSGAVLGTTSALTLNVFTYIEWKVTLSASVGTHDVRFNGITAMTPLTGQNTASMTTWNTFELGQRNFGNSWPGGAMSVDYDDLYASDGSGASPWNGFLGDCRVDAGVPSGAGASAQWTPSAGSNYQNVDDAAPDDDATYNETTTVGHVDTFVVPDAASAGATIRGVQVNLSAKKTDAGECTIAPVVRHSSTNYVGADIAPATAYANLTGVFQTNPGTSAAWVEADFNAAEFGYKRTA